MNKLIQLALFFTLMLTGCSNSSTSSESKVETTVKTTAAFPQKELEKELKKLKPVSLDMKFESPLATELGKRKAKEEAEKQRQIAAEKKLEKEREAKRKKQQEEKAERQRLAEQQAAERQRLAEAERQAELERQRQAAIQKEQKANAEKKRQSQAQRQQTEAPSSNSQDPPSSSSQTDKTIQQPASELPDDDGYGYEERKKWHDDQVEWGIKQGISIPKTHHKIKKAKAFSLGLSSDQLHEHRDDQNRYHSYYDNSNTCHRSFNFSHLNPDRYTKCMSGCSKSQSFRNRIFHFKHLQEQCSERIYDDSVKDDRKGCDVADAPDAF